MDASTQSPPSSPEFNLPRAPDSDDRDEFKLHSQALYELVADFTRKYADDPQAKSEWHFINAEFERIQERQRMLLCVNYARAECAEKERDKFERQLKEAQEQCDWICEIYEEERGRADALEKQIDKLHALNARTRPGEAYKRSIDLQLKEMRKKQRK